MRCFIIYVSHYYDVFPQSVSKVNEFSHRNTKYKLFLNHKYIFNFDVFLNFLYQGPHLFSKSPAYVPTKMVQFEDICIY